MIGPNNSNFSILIINLESFSSRCFDDFVRTISTAVKIFLSSRFRRDRAMKIAEPNTNDSSDRYVAWLNLGEAAPLTRCYVENVSRSGAKLEIFHAPIPNEFTLHFNRKGDAKVRCRVTAAAGSTCDVEFVSSLAIYG